MLTLVGSVQQFCLLISRPRPCSSIRCGGTPHLGFFTQCERDTHIESTDEKPVLIIIPFVFLVLSLLFIGGQAESKCHSCLSVSFVFSTLTIM